MGLFINILWVMLGGGAGAVCRYLLEELMKYTGPWLGVATWVINTVGCLLIGILAGWVMTATWSAGSKNIVHLLLITGLCGGFTTFSSFTLDCVKYFESGQVAAGLIYVMMTLFVGLSCCALGYWIGAKF